MKEHLGDSHSVPLLLLMPLLFKEILQTWDCLPYWEPPLDSYFLQTIFLKSNLN